MADAILSAGGVYAIRNVLDGRVYVGSALNLRRRWSAHKSLLRLGRHHSLHLQRAWARDGEESFVFEVLEYVADAATILQREQWHIDYLGAASGFGYNILKQAGSRLGFRHSEETKQRISLAFAGKKNPGQSARMRGRKLSPEHVQKMAAAHLGSKRSDETRQKISQAAVGNQRWLGKSHSEEAKQKIAAKAKAREPRRGWNHSEESKRLMSVNRRRVAVVVGGVRFESLEDAGRHFGRDPTTIANWVKSGKAVKA